MSRDVPHQRLAVHAPSLAERLERFIGDTVRHRFGFERVVLGLSGGVDSATVATLAARALGSDGVVALLMPYRDLAADTLERATAVAEALGIRSERLDITAMVDAYAETRPEMTWHRRGNVQARARMIVQFDAMVEHGALPIGTGNKTELLFGYFTEHGDDAAKVQPLLDLYKTQVWQVAAEVGVPHEIIDAVPSAGLEPEQTDEGDFGLRYEQVDLVLAHLEAGYTDAEIVGLGLGIDSDVIAAVRRRVASTHGKRLATLVPQVQPGPLDPVLFLRGAR